MFEFMHNAGGHTPMTRRFPATADGLLKGQAVALVAGKLVLSTGTGSGAESCIGIAQEASSAADQMIEVIIASPDAVFKTQKSGDRKSVV